MGTAAPVPLRECGIVTAYNPASRPRDPGTNERANARLRRCLQRLRLRSLPVLALGTGPEAQCWNEPGFAILGCTRPGLVRLGARFGQNAIVWIDAGGGVRLVATRAGFGGCALGEDLPA